MGKAQRIFILLWAIAVMVAGTFVPYTVTYPDIGTEGQPTVIFVKNVGYRSIFTQTNNTSHFAQGIYKQFLTIKDVKIDDNKRSQEVFNYLSHCSVNTSVVLIELLVLLFIGVAGMLFFMKGKA